MFLENNLTLSHIIIKLLLKYANERFHIFFIVLFHFEHTLCLYMYECKDGNNDELYSALKSLLDKLH